MLKVDGYTFHTDDFYTVLQTLFESNQLQPSEFPKNTLLAEQGKIAEFCYLITQGDISINTTVNSGRRYQQGYFKNHGLIGAMEISGNIPSLCNVIAETDLVAYRIPYETLLSLVCNNPQAAQLLISHITKKWYSSAGKMIRNILHPIKYNIIFDIIDQYQATGSTEFKINKSKEAERQGTSLRVYNRILNELQNKQIIDYQRSSVIIVDVEKLKAELDRVTE